MLEGMDETELKAYLDENPRIVLLFEIDVLETANEYVTLTAPDKADYETNLESLQ